MEGLTRDKLNALVRIAEVDGEIAEEEKELIVKIAEDQGYSRENVKYVINNPEPLGDFSDLSSYERLEFMYLAISVMQADDLVYNSEMVFCKNLARKLGISPEVVDVYGTRSDVSIETFINEAQKYVEN